jgi:hypothetical protein
LITGLASNLVDIGVVVLQYVDDTILLIQDSEEQAINLKLMLFFFETMPGLKINFEKSEVMIVLEDDAKAHDAALFNYQK